MNASIKATLATIYVVVALLGVFGTVFISPHSWATGFKILMIVVVGVFFIGMLTIGVINLWRAFYSRFKDDY